MRRPRSARRVAAQKRDKDAGSRSRRRGGFDGDLGSVVRTWQVTSPASNSCAGDRRDHPIRRSPYASNPDHERRSSAGRVAVLRLRRTRPRRRGSLRCSHHLVLRNQRVRRPRLLPPLARRPQPRRHRHHRLERRSSGGHPLRRVPLPRRVHGREDGRSETRHPLRPLGAHGDGDRRAATRVGCHRERARASLGARDPPDPGRRRR